MDIKVVFSAGGTSVKENIREIKSGWDIIIGTPGRINDLLEKKIIQTERIQILVLDEADEMLDRGF